jgi:3-deoxy-7-phosphoheptulonate synthase
VNPDLANLPRSSTPHQPPWGDRAEIHRVRDELRTRPGLVSGEDVRRLRGDLAEVTAGNARVIQAGDCAEDPAESTGRRISEKASVIEALASAMTTVARTPVVAAGRIGGQYGKPRSNPTQQVGDVELPVYRGHMVNTPEPDPEGRNPDPQRLLSGYRAASEVMDHLGWGDGRARPAIDVPIWTSHEALLLDYEVPMLRRDGGELLLASTHWPWIGERTRQADGDHVAVLAEVVNPVACKVGPRMTPDELLALCARLDPSRQPGRLTLIARMGAATVTDVLPRLVAVVRAEGHPVIWLCDPMHANTVTAPNGLKTRFLDAIVQEVRAFQRIVEGAGGVAGGLHLETAADDVTECVPSASHVDRVGQRYTSFCDPRLNPSQAVSVVSTWNG